ncbi:MAG: hypothetical protein U0324_16035 [Polyangiales bacterium]
MRVSLILSVWLILVAALAVGCSAPEAPSRPERADSGQQDIPDGGPTPPAICDPTTCDRDCLAVGQRGGVCRSDRCLCLDGGRDGGTTPPLPADAATADAGPVLGPSCAVSRSGTARDVALVWCPEDWRSIGNDGRAGPVNPPGTIEQVPWGRLVAVRMADGSTRYVDAVAASPRMVPLTPEWSEIELARRVAGLALAITGLQDTSHALTTRSLAGVTVTETPSGATTDFEASNLLLRSTVLHRTNAGPDAWVYLQPRAAGLDRVLGAVRSLLEHRDAISSTRRWSWPTAALCSPDARLEASAGLAAPMMSLTLAPDPALAARVLEAHRLGWNSSASARQTYVTAQVLDLYVISVTAMLEGAAVASTVTEAEPSGLVACAADLLGSAVIERVLLDVVPRVIEAAASHRELTPQEFLDMAASALNDEWPRLALEGLACGTRESCTAAIAAGATAPVGLMCRVLLAVGHALRDGASLVAFEGDVALSGGTELFTYATQEGAALPFDRSACGAPLDGGSDVPDTLVVPDAAPDRPDVPDAAMEGGLDVPDVPDTGIDRPTDAPAPRDMPDVLDVLDVPDVPDVPAEPPCIPACTTPASAVPCGSAIPNACAGGPSCGTGTLCPSSQVCTVSRCVASMVCTPGASRCSDSSTAETCSSTGDRWVRSACGSGSTCTSGRCVATATCVFERHSDGGFREGFNGGDCATARGVSRCLQSAAYNAASTRPGLECFDPIGEQRSSMSIDFEVGSHCQRGAFHYRGNVYPVAGRCPSRVDIDLVMNGGSLSWRCASSEVSGPTGSTCALSVDCPWDLAGTSIGSATRVDPWFAETINGNIYNLGTAYRGSCTP